MYKIASLILVITILPFFGCTNYHNLDYKKAERLEQESGFVDWIDHSMRRKPITNREYLIFLSWSLDFYGESYPDYVVKLIPGEQVDGTSSTAEKIYEILRSPNDQLKQYHLNSHYIDYPVTGLNFFQLEELYKWMSDRYAEYKLIKLNHLNYNSSQKDEDCFSLESFLCTQYMGLVNSTPRPRLSDNILIPNFRPPFIAEKPTISHRYKGPPTWREYGMEKSDFLWLWNQEYIQNDGGKITIDIKYNHIPVANNGETANYEQFHSAFYIKYKSQFYAGAKYIDIAAGLEKNKFGKMPFLYIGQNAYGRPIILENYKFNPASVPKPTGMFYWLAFSIEVESNYWPKN